ncbi:hypothetical protein WR25_01820 [Diploscapter pachys]|uniref:Uncharacterized protein n=1 Tax=Diploscapter pachys TaxID=2018661 RepID=A0A2A2K8D5_9BILA|nr:hypothetical protein WR25_01820 [Diploscapter pachys]
MCPAASERRQPASARRLPDPARLAIGAARSADRPAGHGHRGTTTAIKRAGHRLGAAVHAAVHGLPTDRRALRSSPSGSGPQCAHPSALTELSSYN